MSSGLPGRYARDIRPQDRDLARAPENDSDPDRQSHTRESRQSFPTGPGLEARHLDITSLFNDPTTVTTTVLKARAIQIRDILSTFSRNDFPSEHVQTNIFNRIALLDEPKAITDCIEKEDLLSTIFLLAVNNSAQYHILRHVFPEDMCAQYFQQKLQRRVEAQLQAFDLLDVAASGSNPPNQDHILARVGMIAAELNHIVRVVKEDREHRWQGEAETVKQLIYMIQAVCRRNYCPGDRSGNRNSNLFQVLVGTASSREAGFGLVALAACSKEVVISQVEDLNLVRGLLVQNDAPQAYIGHFDEIIAT